MTISNEQAKTLWQDLLEKDDRTSPTEYPDMALITFEEFTAALASAGLRSRIEGLKEAQALSPIDDDAAMFTVHRERERLHNAIDAILASLQPEVAKREDILP